MKQACISLRPGTIFGYKNEAWKVIQNETLDRIFTARNIATGSLKKFRYAPGQEMSVRWKPFSNDS